MGAAEVKAYELLASLPNSEEEELMLAMFHYDMWQKSGAEPGFVDFRESVKTIKANPVMAAVKHILHKVGPYVKYNLHITKIFININCP